MKNFLKKIFRGKNPVYSFIFNNKGKMIYQGVGEFPNPHYERTPSKKHTLAPDEYLFTVEGSSWEEAGIQARKEFEALMNGE